MATVLFTNVRILDGSYAGPFAGEVCCSLKDGAFYGEPERVAGHARWSLPAA